MGVCISHIRELDLVSDSFSETIGPGEAKFYGLQITRQWLDRKMDLVVRVHVEHGRLARVYCARDRPFPNQRRAIWTTDRYCACPSPTCDHCYPHCLNDLGGLCVECMVHDEKWDRMSHEMSLGGLSMDQVSGNGSASGVAVVDEGAQELRDAGLAVVGDEPNDVPYASQADFEFSMRLSPTGPDARLLAPGHFFLTIEAAAEVVPKKIRKQRRLEGEPEYHETTYSLWIEERAPKTAPQTGNEARVEEARARLAVLQERAAKKRQFGRKIDADEAEKKEAAVERAKMIEMGLDPDEEVKRKKKNADRIKAEAEAEAAANAGIEAAKEPAATIADPPATIPSATEEEEKKQ